MKRIALIHTVKSVLNSFEDRIRNAIDGELIIHNMLDDFLASDAAERGKFTQENLNRLFYDIRAAELTGADVIAVTCSTLTPAVVKIRPFIKTPVVAIDDAMTKLAVELGERITILATAQSTVEPTRSKLMHDAAQIKKRVSASVLVCDEAYTAIKKLDFETHDRLIKEMALSIKNQDVVVLAQASMAHLEQDIRKICGCPVLSSPELCVGQIKQIIKQKGE
ncbi:aspartate/glutamate racemase family protein [Oscillospiraceae bacterium PP1C4]